MITSGGAEHIAQRGRRPIGKAGAEYITADGVEYIAEGGAQHIPTGGAEYSRADTRVSALETAPGTGLAWATTQLCTALETVGPQRVGAVAPELRAGLIELITALLEGRAEAAAEEPWLPVPPPAPRGPVLVDNF